MSSPQANSVYSSTSKTTSTNVFIAVIADSSIYRLNANDQVACLIIGQGASVKDVSIDTLNTANGYFAGALI